MAQIDFRTLILRVDASIKSAVADGFQTLSAGDSVKVVLTNLPGATVGSLELFLFSKASPAVALVTPATSFAAVPGRHDSFYATLDLASAALTSAMSALEPGEPLVARLYVADANVVWADTDISIYPSPHLDQSSWPDPEAPFAREDDVILKADLLAGVTPIVAMPTLTAAQREARFEALLQLLSSLSAP